MWEFRRVTNSFWVCATNPISRGFAHIPRLSEEIWQRLGSSWCWMGLGQVMHFPIDLINWQSWMAAFCLICKNCYTELECIGIIKSDFLETLFLQVPDFAFGFFLMKCFVSLIQKTLWLPTKREKSFDTRVHNRIHETQLFVQQALFFHPAISPSEHWVSQRQNSSFSQHIFRLHE